MKFPIPLTRAAAMLTATLALGAASAPACAQNRYNYSGYDAYGPRVYGYRYVPRVYGYGPPYYYGYRRGFAQDPDDLPVGSGAWWRAMDRANRGGNVGGSGSR
jgi:ABC-type sugar transport system substrate-binding protein